MIRLEMYVLYSLSGQKTELRAYMWKKFCILIIASDSKAQEIKKKIIYRQTKHKGHNKWKFKS